MPMTKPVAQLISALERAGLAAHAIELRDYINAGVPIDPPTLRDLATRAPLETMRRRFEPREEVEAAVAYLTEYLVAPYRQIEMAERIAGRLGAIDGVVSKASRRRQILLIDERFEDRRPTPAVTQEELVAVAEIEKRLPGMREAMLREIDGDGDGGGGAPVNPTAPIPRGSPDQARRSHAAEATGIQWDETILDRIRRELGEPETAAHGD